MKRSEKLFYVGIGIALATLVPRWWKQADGFKQAAAPHVFGLLARNGSIGDVAAELEATGNRISQQLIDRMPTERNYTLLSHVIGIERWGQSRLKVILGEPFVPSEYDQFRPERGLSWNQLQDIFAETRAETIQLAAAITADGLEEGTALHNEFGELTAFHWLVYLRGHATIELLKLN